MKAFLFLAIIFFTSVSVFSQNIKGTVTDSTGKPVPYANINLKSDSNLIVAYAISSSNGNYSLTVPGGVKQHLKVEVICIGFKQQTKAVTDFAAPLNFILSQSVNQLAAVTIKSSRPVLRTHGDTLSYKVSDFSSPQDRVIGDVIKKLPGISVASDGTISYNNKPVSAVYIGGDNLLDDKYSIATNTIPHGAVNQVQVIQNDQPVKALQNKVMSDDVALNLEIKKEAKLPLLGQENIGLGLPGNYDIDLNAMMFKDNYKAINYLGGNNIGYDVQQDLISHNRTDYIQRIDNASPATVLSLGAVNTPGLAEDRYLFDQAGVINLNNLINLKKNVQLKVNAYYVHDTQRQDYSQQTTVFLPGDTVKYNSIQHNRSVPDILHTQFTLNINRDKYYLNDALLMDQNRTISHSGLKTDSTSVNQVFKDNPLNFSNELNLIKSLKSNNMIQVYSYISHSAEPENRAIGPGYNAALFNNNTIYLQLLQNVNVPTWYSNNYFSLKIPSGLLTQSFRTGFSVQSQTLTSNLDVVQNNGSINLESDSALNHINWTKKKVYAEAAYDLPGTDKALKANLTLPLTLQQIKYSDSLYSLNKGLTRLYFNPQLRVKYQTSTENYLTFLYNYRNETGTIEDLYRGYILTDYRTLNAHNAALTEQQNQTAAAGFNYRRALVLFFWSINARYNRIEANNIASSIITNSLQEGIVLPYPNATDSWTFNGSFSKYIFALRTTFSGAIQWQSNHSVQIQNNTLLPFNTIAETLNINADTKVTDQVNFSYKATLTQTESYSPVDVSAFHVDQLQQQASLNYDPVEDVECKLSGEHYFTRQEGNPDLKYFFADASVKFRNLRFKKLKTDVEISGVNLLNVKNYRYLNLAANTLTASAYTLPGRIIMLRLFFNI